jgi:hypothetical protein
MRSERRSITRAAACERLRTLRTFEAKFTYFLTRARIENNVKSALIVRIVRRPGRENTEFARITRANVLVSRGNALGSPVVRAIRRCASQVSEANPCVLGRRGEKPARIGFEK